MCADERSQRALQRRLEETLGDEHAVTLMEQLASKHDLMTLGQRIDDGVDALEQRVNARVDALEQRVNARMDALEQRVNARMDGLEQRSDLKLETLENRVLSTVRSELVAQTRTFFLGMVGSVATVGALAFAAARLT